MQNLFQCNSIKSIIFSLIFLFIASIQSFGSDKFEIHPQNTVITCGVPDNVEILSINNSLIYTNGQNTYFYSIANRERKSASWTMHSWGGHKLIDQWNDGEDIDHDGNLSAKALVRSRPWTHIILQEFSTVPLNSFETFKDGVGKWVNYIRENCPNPDAVIIIPINWPKFSGEPEDFSKWLSEAETIIANNRKISQEFGVLLCPVGVAYQTIGANEGIDGIKAMMIDDIHPTSKATYLAACMEYQLIYGLDATTIRWKPGNITDEEALEMRELASATLLSFDHIVFHHFPTVRFEFTHYDDEDNITPFETDPEISIEGECYIDDELVFTANRIAGEYIVNVRHDNATVTAKVKVKTVNILSSVSVLNDDSSHIEFHLSADGLLYTTQECSMISLYDLNGIMIASSNSSEISTTGLTAGLYVVNCITKLGQATSSLIRIP